ncbi:MAG TPA: serine hydrolase [Puia sp.]|jgi:CubicO group peptidase (beta-lactamase class C family)|nr:serine hydrolase [Puia sp.]
MKRLLPILSLTPAGLTLSRLALIVSIGLLAPTALLAQRRHNADNPFSGLDTAFARVLKDWHAAGFAVAVVDKDTVIYAKGFGYKDWEHKVPVTPHTLFAIGSCTKAFTASLIGMLEHDGKLDIDKPVRDYLPELKFYNPEMNETITLRDMMCHRTGLPRHDLSWYLFGNSTRDSMILKIQYMQPTAGVREIWQYNNFMFAAQGVVAEHLTGKSWERNVTDRIFQPLGMAETDFSVADLAKAPDAALGYGLKSDSIIKKLDYYLIGALGPAGSINSNVIDMSKWVETWIHGGKYKGKEIFPANYASQAITAQMAMGGGLPTKEAPDVFFSSYGFGWMLSSYRGHYRVEHGGNIDGFSASTCFFPSDSIGIIVLSNQNGSAVPSIVRNLISDRLLHLSYKDWDSYLKGVTDKAKADAKKALTSRQSNRIANAPLTHSLNDYTGIYSNPGYGSFEITAKDDSLFASFPLHTWWLKHYHYDVFQPFDKDPKEGIDTTDDGDNLRLQFDMDAAGSITNVAVNLEAALSKPIIFTRTPKTASITTAQLQQYVGDYAFSEAVAARIYVKGEKLFLLVTGQPEYELAYIGGNSFSIKSLTGFTVRFDTDDKGKIVSLTSIQPNGKFTAKRKP